MYFFERNAGCLRVCIVRNTPLSDRNTVLVCSAISLLEKNTELEERYPFKRICQRNTFLSIAVVDRIAYYMSKGIPCFFAGNTWYFEQVLFLWKTPHLSNENCVSQTLHIFNWQLYHSKEYFKYKQKICWMLPAFLNLTLHWFNPCFIFGRCVLYIKHCPGGILHPLKKDACFEWTSFI